VTDQDGSESEPATAPIHPVAAVIDTCFFGAGNFKPDNVENSPAAWHDGT